jgi:SPP1 family predicted phage head-tail adaptor
LDLISLFRMLSTKQDLSKLDRRITFERKVIVDNPSNEDAEDGWVSIDTNPEVWAEVDEKSGTEEFKADQLNGVKTAAFITRYRSDLNTRMRIDYGGEKYDVHSILAISRKRFLRIVGMTGLMTYKETET